MRAVREIRAIDGVRVSRALECATPRALSKPNVANTDRQNDGWSVCD